MKSVHKYLVEIVDSLPAAPSTFFLSPRQSSTSQRFVTSDILLISATVLLYLIH